MASNDKDNQITRRIRYMELLDKGAQIDEAIEHQNVLETLSDVREIISRCESIANDFISEGKVENAVDYLLDAQVIKMSHELVLKTTSKIANSEFRDDEFLVALCELFTSNDPDLLLNHALTCSFMAQFHLPMLGTFDLNAPPREPKVKKVRQTQKKDLGPKKAPENVKQIVKSDKGAEKINKLRSEFGNLCRARKTKCLPYFETIIDPTSFMRSVDRAFQIAFLVRDGVLGLKRIKDEPYVYIAEATSTHNRTQAGGSDEHTVQTVMSLTPQLWKEEIQKYNLQAPLLNLDGDINDSIESDASDDD